MAYASVAVEGGLFPSDLLDRIATGEAEGQRPADFGLDGGRRLVDEIQSAFSDARSFWDAFQRRLERSRESKTTITREDWVVPFLELLGFYQIQVQRASAEAGGEKYPISHRAGDGADSPPVHIVALEQELDRREGARRSPHALVQDYLNRSDALWGIVTNGRRLRLLRDSARLAKPTYLEFDLEGMITGNLYSEFVLLYRLTHSSRFPRDAAAAHECLLERYYQQGIDEGGRVRDKLREGVEEALRVLGTAFLAHPDSCALRDRVAGGQLDAPRYYRQLLRLVYRLLFLMVAEERRLIFPPGADMTRQAVYTKYYSVTRLRDRAERYFAGDTNGDLWLGLRETFRLFRNNDAAQKLGLAALDGELFGRQACEDLEEAGCTNNALLTAVRRLSTFVDEGTGRGRRRGAGLRRRVNYAGLDVEEFGSVYESLLDYHPQVTPDPLTFDLVAGSERKQTGSYYTPPELVRELVESALVPVMEERLKAARTREDKQEALLGLRVCDPAAGSGHFLLAAARRIARELAKVRSGEHEPSPEEYRRALRDVIRHCVYAVDKNPLAVDLCKVALWMEGHNAGLPLSFLDNHVKCGDSLVGVADLDVLLQGIPDDAYKPVTGDDKEAAKHYRNRSKREREGQLALPVGAAPAGEGQEALAREFDALAQQEERTPGDVAAKEELYESLRGQGTAWWTRKVACDLWTYAFFAPLHVPGSDHVDRVPTTGDMRGYLLKPNAANGALIGEAVGFSQQMPFFHWPLEFPDVFAHGGFDVVLGNPPWERIKLQEQEFFAARDREIAGAPNKAARERLILQLGQRNPALAREFAQAKHSAESQSKFVRESGRFPLAGVGDVNTYSVFAELFRRLLQPAGRAGTLIPSGIATDHTTREFFRDLVERRSLVSLYEFENEGFFPTGQGHMNTFCLLTLAGPERPAGLADFVFQATRIEELRDDERHFVMSPAEFSLLNPNTLTCPIFRTKRDAGITEAIHRRVPVLIKEGPPEENPWGISFMAMFHMSNDSHLFRTREQLFAAGWRLEGNIFLQGGKRYLPLFEAKMLYQFDHRFGDYSNVPGGEAHVLPDVPAERYSDPTYQPLPRYWVHSEEVEGSLRSRWNRYWLLGWREITDSRASARAVISTVLPRLGVGNKFLLMFPNVPPKKAAALLASLNSLALDYCARQKLGGKSLSYFVMRQLPVPGPAAYDRACPWSPEESSLDWIVMRVLELVYTAWDMAHFAKDLAYDGSPFRWDELRRFLLRCELDAAFFNLYGIERDDVDYIMETFPVVKRRDERRFGEYRTKSIILEIYDEIAQASRSGQSYQTRLDPPPADPRVAHSSARERSAVEVPSVAPSPRAESRPEPAFRQGKEKKERTEGLLTQLRSQGLEVIDDRSGGGHLWVIGGKELFQLLMPRGFVWGPRGAPATGNRAGWCLPKEPT